MHGTAEQFPSDDSSYPRVAGFFEVQGFNVQNKSHALGRRPCTHIYRGRGALAAGPLSVRHTGSSPAKGASGSPARVQRLSTPPRSSPKSLAAGGNASSTTAAQIFPRGSPNAEKAVGTQLCTHENARNQDTQLHVNKRCPVWRLEQRRGRRAQRVLLSAGWPRPGWARHPRASVSSRTK